MIGPALTQEQVSHYDQNTNRCYVELNVNMADLTKYESYYDVFLFDGQTREMLAYARSEKGVKTEFVKNGPDSLSFIEVRAWIDARMAHDRKQ